MSRSRILLLLFFALLSFTWLFSSGVLKKEKGIRSSALPAHNENSGISLAELKLKANDIKTFAKNGKYSASVCFLVDMSLPSGQNRFFVYNLDKDTIQRAGLVTHGRCNEFWLEGRKYGNTPGCGCTSLGKYKVGYSYNGRFGLAFKLYGLDKTNDKAFERFVVLHSHSCVPESETTGDICQSDGCPTVSPGFLQYLQKLIGNSKKPILLWIFE